MMVRNILLSFMIVCAPCMAYAQSVATYDQMHLAQLLAPIALYPDPLLGQVLSASTNPVQIVEAARWLQDPANSHLQGDSLGVVVQGMDMDPNVKSLLVFPQLLSAMNARIDWTQQVGNAFTMQQADVLNVIQELRWQAYQAGNLQSNDRQTIINQDNSLEIKPADPRVLYLPIYDMSVYGAWPYAANPPYALINMAAYVPAPPVIIQSYTYWAPIAYDWHNRSLIYDHNRPIYPVVGQFGLNNPAGPYAQRDHDNHYDHDHYEHDHFAYPAVGQYGPNNPAVQNPQRDHDNNYDHDHDHRNVSGQRPPETPSQPQQPQPQAPLQPQPVHTQQPEIHLPLPVQPVSTPFSPTTPPATPVAPTHSPQLAPITNARPVGPAAPAAHAAAPIGADTQQPGNGKPPVN